MPYKIKGKVVYHKVKGHWSIKEKTHSHANAVKAVRLLHGIESGWKPTRLNKKR
jgi:hypothetical protein